MNRYLKPLETLSEDWFTKVIVAGLAAAWTFLTDMFATRAELVVLLMITIVIDFITGIVASKRASKNITSLGFRQTVIKIIEYFLILALLAGIANTFKGQIPFVEYFVSWGYFFAIITEVKSVVENVTKGKDSTVKDVWEHVMDKLDEKRNG